MGPIKIIAIHCLIILLFNCSPKAMTSLSDEAYKEWDQKKKEMNPEQFKNLVESNDQLEAENEDLKEKEAYLHQSLDKKDNEINRLTHQMEQIKTAPFNSKSKENEMTKWDKGVVFKVQLAAFDDYDLRNLTENGSDLKIIDEDGYIKYVLGQFRDYEMADKFKKKLRKLGVKEAWIVPYKDGERVPLKEVLGKVVDE
ncbi:MAG: hypothetical protein WDZ72_05885 [Cyclobacteriaceae bacterium]